MTKVVKETPKLRKGDPLKLKRVRDPQTGAMITMHTVHTGSATFASDLSHAFRNNVQAALKKTKSH